MSKRLSKYIASFDYFDKSVIALSLTSGSISIALFGTVIGATAGIASACFSLEFPTSNGIAKKKLLKITQNKNKEHNKIFMLPRSKLNSIESKISEASINEISHEVFMKIISKGKNYPELKESQRVDTEKANWLKKIKK